MGTLVAFLAVMILVFIFLAFGLCLYPVTERDMEGY